jgi:hypothetical protein
MLYVNQKLISTSNVNPDYEFAHIVKDYHKSIKEIKDYYGDFIVLETKIRPRSDTKTGLPRFPGARGLLLISNVNMTNSEGDSSTLELRYSPVILKVEEGNLVHENPNLLIHKGSYSIDIKRFPDLAYYIWRCGKVGHTPAEGKKFHLYDIKATNQQTASKRRAEGAVLNLIYSSLPEGDLRILAKSWGVDGVDGMDSESVREMLFQKLQDGEDNKRTNPKSRGFKEFISSSQVKEIDKLTAMCKDAETSGKLKYRTEDRTWVIDYKDGGNPYTLKELAGEEFGDPLGSLVSYLATNAEALRKVRNVMGLSVPPRQEAPVVEKAPPPKEESEPVIPRMDAPLYTVEQVLQESNTPRLKKMLKEVDPDIGVLPRTLKGEDVKKMLLQRLGQASLQETQG